MFISLDTGMMPEIRVYTIQAKSHDDLLKTTKFCHALYVVKHPKYVKLLFRMSYYFVIERHTYETEL